MSYATPVLGEAWTDGTQHELGEIIAANNAAALVDVARADALAAAVLHLSTGETPDDPADDWPNQGTGGTALNAVPVSVRGCKLSSADPDVFAAHTSTDVTDAFTTPHAAANNVDSADLISVRAKWRAVGDAEAAGTEDGSMAFGKIQSLDTGVGGYGDPDWSIWVGLATPFTVGGINAIWHDDADAQQSYGTTAVVDPYEWNEVRWDLLIDGPGSDSTLTFYTGVDGVWTQVGDVTTISGGTTVRDNAGPVVAAAMSVMVEYCELWKDGVLSVSFRPEDAEGVKGPGETFTSADTAEVWTLGTDCAVLERPAGGGFLCGGSTALQVPDANALDIGTSDWSIAQVVTVPDTVTVDGAAYDYATKQSAGAPVGAGGTGFRLVDVKIDGFGIDGFGYVASDGTDMAFAISNTGWTAGASHVVVGTFDRDGNLVTYVDGTARGSASMTAGPGAVGSISTSTALVFGKAASPPFILEGHAQWDRLLTADEIAALTTLTVPVP